MIRCHRDDSSQFLARTMTAAELSVFEDHLETCADCRERLERSAGGENAWKSARELLVHGLRHEDVAGKSSVAGVDGIPPDLDWRPNGTSAVVLSFLAPSDDPAMVGRIGQYEICGIVGRGSTGIVLKGFDRSLNRNVAIKVLDPALADIGAARQRFSREARAMAAIADEHLVPIYEVSEHSGLPFFVMEYVPGGSLERRLHTIGPFDAIAVVRIGLQVARALAAAHQQGLVHRDIKPGNILLDRGTERVRVVDFGLVRVSNDVSCTRSGVVTGTPQYMAPEQVRAEICDGQSDLFSLGAVMYALCTGHPPFRADTIYGVMQRIVHDEPRSIREDNPSIPEWLDQFIGRMLSKDRAGRFASAKEVVAILQENLAHMQRPDAVPAPSTSWVRRSASSSPQTSRRKIAGALVLTVILLSLCVIFWPDFTTKTPTAGQSDGAALDLSGTPANRWPTIPLWDADGTKELRAANAQLQSEWHNPSPANLPDSWSNQIDVLDESMKRLGDALAATRPDNQVVNAADTQRPAVAEDSGGRDNSGPISDGVTDEQKEVAKGEIIDQTGQPSLETLRAAIARHEDAFEHPTVGYRVTMRPNPDLSFKERSIYPWADGKKHQTVIEYSRNAPHVWLWKNSELTDGLLRGRSDMISDGEVMLNHSRYSNEEFVYLDRQVDHVTPPLPLYGVFPLHSVFGPESRPLSKVVMNLPDTTVDWDGEEAKVSFQYGPVKGHERRFEVWFSKRLDWFPVRVRRYEDKPNMVVRSEWNAGGFARVGESWYATKGTIDWRDPENVAAGKVAYSQEFEVLEINLKPDLPLAAFRVDIPKGATVRDLRKESPKKVPGKSLDIGPNARSLSLVFQDVWEKPIDDVVVTARWSVDSTAEAHSDEMGKAHFAALPDAVVVLECRHPKYRLLNIAVGTDGESLTLKLASRTRGVVLDHKGEPVPEVLVASSALNFGNNGIPEVHHGPSLDGARDYTDAVGEFDLFDALPRGGESAGVIFAFHPKAASMAIRRLKPKELAETVKLVLSPARLVKASYLLPGVNLDQASRLTVSWLDDLGERLGSLEPKVEVVQNGLRVDVAAYLPKGTYQLLVRNPAMSLDHKSRVDVPDGADHVDLGTTTIAAKGLAALRGEPAPELSVRTWSDGRGRSLKELRGKVVILYFWGHWCGPCVQGMPQLMAMADEFREQPVAWIAVHDGSVRDFTQFGKLIARKRELLWKGRDIPFPVAFDAPDPQADEPDGVGSGKTHARYGIQEWPTLVLIDTNGLVVGAVSKDELATQLKVLCRRP